MQESSLNFIIFYIAYFCILYFQSAHLWLQSYGLTALSLST